MKYVFGGYGLFGVILDVTLELTENEVYTIHTVELQTEEYESYFTNLLDNKNTAMHYARVSVAPSTFLDEMYVIDYNYTGKQDHNTPLKGERDVRLSKLALDLGRQGGFLENVFGKLKNYILTQSTVIRLIEITLCARNLHSWNLQNLIESKSCKSFLFQSILTKNT